MLHAEQRAGEGDDEQRRGAEHGEIDRAVEETRSLRENGDASGLPAERAMLSPPSARIRSATRCSREKRIDRKPATAPSMSAGAVACSIAWLNSSILDNLSSTWRLPSPRPFSVSVQNHHPPK